MRLKRFRAKNYRVFKEFDFTFPDENCLIVVDDNEAGKSSLLLGILYCLYSHKKDPSITSDSLLELEFSLKGELYRVIAEGTKKRLYKNERDITAQVYKKVGRSYRYLIGETLLDLNDEEFLRTALVKQHELIRSELSSQASSLVPKIQSMVELSSEGQNSAHAIELLKRGLQKNYPRITLKNRARGDARQELKALSKRLEESLSVKNHIIEKLSHEEEIIKQYESILEDIKNTRQKAGLYELKALLARLSEEDKKRKEILSLKEELKSLEPYPSLSSAEAVEIESELKGKKLFLQRERERLSMKVSELKALERELNFSEKQLLNYADLKGLDIDDAIRLQELSTALSVNLKEYNQAERTLEELKHAFPVSLKEFSLLHNKIQSLSAQDRKLLEEYPYEQKRLSELADKFKKLDTLKKRKAVFLTLAVFFAVLAISLSFLHKGFLSLLLISLIFIYISQNLSKKIKTFQSKEELEGVRAEDVKTRLILNEEGIRRIKELYSIDSSSYVEYLRLYSDFKRITDTEKELSELLTQRKELIKEINSIFPFKDEPTPETVNSLIGRIKRAKELKKELELKEQALNKGRTDIEGIKKEIEQALSSVRDIIKKRLSIDVEGKKEEELFSDAFERLERAKRAVKIKEALKNIELLDEEKLQELEKRVSELSRELSLEKPPEHESSSNHYEEQAKAMHTKLNLLHERLSNFEAKRRELFSLKDSLREVEDKILFYNQKISELNQYIKAVEKALLLLQKIAFSNYSLWAERLNHDATEILKSITGKNRRIHFGKDLNFRIASESEDLSEDDINWFLSGGTAEQLYLALRIAVLRHLKPDVKIPLILDEPFAHADDQRFLRAMRFITERLSEERQIIILSCHRKRHLDIRDRLKGNFYIRDGIT